MKAFPTPRLSSLSAIFAGWVLHAGLGVCRVTIQVGTNIVVMHKLFIFAHSHAYRISILIPHFHYPLVWRLPVTTHPVWRLQNLPEQSGRDEQVAEMVHSHGQLAAPGTWPLAAGERGWQQESEAGSRRARLEETMGWRRSELSQRSSCKQDLGTSNFWMTS